jgi:hypothetical protein
MRFTFLTSYHVEFHTRARRSWQEGPKRFRLAYGNGIHWVWGRVSLSVEDLTAAVYPVCAECDSPDAREVSYGDEGWTVCPDCQSVEQGYRYVSLLEYENLQ